MDTEVRLVRVVDVDIKFGTMVVLFVKAALAAIPATIILFVIGLVAAVAIRGVGLSLGH